MFGNMTPTRSPGCTPMPASAAAKRDARSSACTFVISCPSKTIDVYSPNRSTFCSPSVAKFMRRSYARASAVGELENQLGAGACDEAGERTPEHHLPIHLAAARVQLGDDVQNRAAGDCEEADENQVRR